MNGNETSELLPTLDMLTRLGVAALLAGVLGLEREAREKPAGLRTHMLVGLGAACFSLAALSLTRSASVGLPIASPIEVDPTRIVQGVVGGIGFLGAGAIIRHQGDVQGLTTAGSIWLVGAVGVSAGAGSYVLATMTTVLAVAILVVLGWVERKFFPQQHTEPEKRDG